MTRQWQKISFKISFFTFLSKNNLGSAFKQGAKEVSLPSSVLSINRISKCLCKRNPFQSAGHWWELVRICLAIFKNQIICDSSTYKCALLLGKGAKIKLNMHSKTEKTKRESFTKNRATVLYCSEVLVNFYWCFCFQHCEISAKCVTCVSPSSLIYRCMCHTQMNHFALVHICSLFAPWCKAAGLSIHLWSSSSPVHSCCLTCQRLALREERGRMQGGDVAGRYSGQHNSRGYSWRQEERRWQQKVWLRPWV